MNCPIIFLLLLLSLSCAHGIYIQSHSSPLTHNLEHRIEWYNKQLCDHDNPTLCTWKQRYAVNDTYYKPGGPVFLFLCGEASMENYYMETLPFELAREHNALYIMIEHRFYGQSIPMADFSTANLKYLSSQQALEDVAQFITDYPIDNDSTWMIYGASYSASLAAWFRTLHPELVKGAVSPSGPIIAEDNMLSYYAMFTHDASEECNSLVQDASDEIVELLKTVDGRVQLSDVFKACDPIEEEDGYFFIWSIVGALGSMTQGQLPPQWPLNQTCQRIENGSSINTTLSVWSDVVSGDTSCVDFEADSYINMLKKTDVQSQDGGRSWFWQKCSEFGFFHDTAEKSSVFPPGINVETNLKWCSLVFGEKIEPHIEYTNGYYSKLFDKETTNILFTNGKLDPWSTLSINKDLPQNGVKAVTYTAGHCAPYHSPTDEDPQDLLDARIAVKKFVTHVLQN